MSEFTDALESSMRLDRRIDLFGCVRLFGFVMGCPVVIRDVPNVLKHRQLGMTELTAQHPMRKLLDSLPILGVR